MELRRSPQAAKIYEFAYIAYILLIYYKIAYKTRDY